jgi:hypothetical protein
VRFCTGLSKRQKEDFLRWVRQLANCTFLRKSAMEPNRSRIAYKTDRRRRKIYDELKPRICTAPGTKIWPELLWLQLRTCHRASLMASSYIFEQFEHATTWIKQNASPFELTSRGWGERLCRAASVLLIRNQTLPHTQNLRGWTRSRIEDIQLLLI